MSSTYLQDPVARVQVALSTSRIFDLRRIHVESREDGAIVLRGRTDNSYNKQLAEKTARLALGDESIDVVNALQPADDRWESESGGDIGLDTDSGLSLTDCPGELPWFMSRLPENEEDAAAAFHRDLPRLLTEHRGKWVAYFGQQRVGIHASRRALYRQCMDAGHQPSKLSIFGIEPPQEIVLDDLLDV